MVNKLLLQLIKDRMEKLTKSEKRIAEYVLSNYESVFNSSIATLAELSGTSDASIIRFCRIFGCKGYQDFKIKLAQEAVPSYKQYNSYLEDNDTTKSIAFKTFQAGIFALQETMQILDVKNLEIAAGKISKARKIFISCSGNSLTVGIDSKIKLLKIGIDCIMESDFDLQLMASARLSSEDVVLCISHTGSTRNLYELLREIKKRGAFIILICAQLKTPMEQLANLTINVCGKTGIFASESPSARIAEMSVIDIILALMAKNHIDKYGSQLETSRRATSKNKF